MKKKIFLICYIFELLLVSLISPVVAAPVPPGGGGLGGAGASPEQLDLDCIKQRLIDPTITCNIEKTIYDRRILIVPEIDCDIANGTNCAGPGLNRCYKIDFNDPALTDIFQCIQVLSTSGVQCGGPCPDAANQCLLLNPIDPDTLSAPAGGYVWRCINPNIVSLNIFGADVGPIEIFLPKFIRLGLSLFFALAGIVTGFQLFSALWESTNSPTEEGLEGAQKKITNNVLGLFFIIIAIVIIQIVASALGISANIFEFAYVP